MVWIVCAVCGVCRGGGVRWMKARWVVCGVSGVYVAGAVQRVCSAPYGERCVQCIECAVYGVCSVWCVQCMEARRQCIIMGVLYRACGG